MSTDPTARLDVVDVAKSFGATRALARASITLMPGEVHTILGENGSGKSTLVKILSGVHRPDAGSLELDGAEGVVLTSPRAARKQGIATVFQEVLTVASQSVLDNVWLGTDGVLRRAGRTADRRSLAADALRSLLGADIDLDANAEDLSLSDRQAICIARALVSQPKVLILDESTASLDIATRDRLFAVLRQLTGRGCSVLFISHRMDEIDEISDRVTVLRSGTTVASGLIKADVSTTELLSLMTGGNGISESRSKAAGFGAVQLRCSDLALATGAKPIDFEIRAGELVGLAGLEGQGQSEFLLALAGLHSAHGEVKRLTDDGGSAVVTEKSTPALGIAYVPRERRGDALFPEMSIRENFALPTLEQDRRGGLLSVRRASARLKPYIHELRIKLASDSDPISSLSGGNQQKVIMARWLASNPSILLLNDPTRGVDIGAKRDLYRLLEKLCASGVSVVMLSSEMDELIELMDRVLVFRENEVFAELGPHELTRSNLVSAYFGQSVEHAA